jgi:hypothetical protein
MEVLADTEDAPKRLEVRAEGALKERLRRRSVKAGDTDAVVEDVAADDDEDDDDDEEAGNINTEDGVDSGENDLWVGAGKGKLESGSMLAGAAGGMIASDAEEGDAWSVSLTSRLDMRRMRGTLVVVTLVMVVVEDVAKSEKGAEAGIGCAKYTESPF